MTTQTCPWCEKPVTLRPAADDQTLAIRTGDPTMITIASWGQTVLLHPICGAQLLNAGMQQKPRNAREQAAHPATGTGAAELMAYAAGHPSTGDRPHLVIVREASR